MRAKNKCLSLTGFARLLIVMWSELYQSTESCEKAAMVNLSGFWEGAYHYPPGGGESVGFDAQIDQTGERFSGIITENNTFDAAAGALLSAALAGTVSGHQVSFKKTYVGEGQAQHSVDYVGVISKDRQRIEGKWTIGWLSGEFEMFRLSTRKDMTAKIALENISR